MQFNRRLLRQMAFAGSCGLCFNLVGCNDNDRDEAAPDPENSFPRQATFIGNAIITQTNADAIAAENLTIGVAADMTTEGTSLKAVLYSMAGAAAEISGEIAGGNQFSATGASSGVCPSTASFTATYDPVEKTLSGYGSGIDCHGQFDDGETNMSQVVCTPVTEQELSNPQRPFIMTPGRCFTVQGTLTPDQQGDQFHLAIQTPQNLLAVLKYEDAAANLAPEFSGDGLQILICASQTSPKICSATAAADAANRLISVLNPLRATSSYTLSLFSMFEPEFPDKGNFTGNLTITQGGMSRIAGFAAHMQKENDAIHSKIYFTHPASAELVTQTVSGNTGILEGQINGEYCNGVGKATATFGANNTAVLTGSGSNCDEEFTMHGNAARLACKLVAEQPSDGSSSSLQNIGKITPGRCMTVTGALTAEEASDSFQFSAQHPQTLIAALTDNHGFTLSIEGPGQIKCDDALKICRVAIPADGLPDSVLRVNKGANAGHGDYQLQVFGVAESAAENLLPQPLGQSRP